MKKLELFIIVFLTIFVTTFSNAQGNTVSVQTSGLENYAELIQKDIVDLTFKIDQSKNQPNPELYNKRGMLFFARKEYENAVKDFQEIIDLNSSHLSEAYFYKALSNFLLGNINCEDFKKAKELGFVADWEKFKSFCPTI